MYKYIYLYVNGDAAPLLKTYPNFVVDINTCRLLVRRHLLPRFIVVVLVPDPIPLPIKPRDILCSTLKCCPAANSVSNNRMYWVYIFLEEKQSTGHGNELIWFPIHILLETNMKWKYLQEKRTTY